VSFFAAEGRFLYVRNLRCLCKWRFSHYSLFVLPVHRFCLKSISRRGHHREIAERINQSDYFGVFNAMLTSELAIVGKASVGANVDLGGVNTSSNIGKDLRKSCTSTAYTYLYSMEVSGILDTENLIIHLVSNAFMFFFGLLKSRSRLTNRDAAIRRLSQIW